MAYQDQIRRRRRFLERLEKRIGRRLVHAFGRHDQRHLGALAMARQLGELDELPDARHHDFVDGGEVALVVDLDRLDDAQVRMRAGGNVAAARTQAAGAAVRVGTLAEQRLRKMQRQDALANAAPAADEQRLRPARARLQGLGRGRTLPWRQRLPCRRRGHRRLAHSESTSATSSARTASGARVASITRMREGSARARAR